MKSNPLIEYLDLTAKYHADRVTMRNILSTLDHELVDMKEHERVSIFADDHYKNYRNIPLQYKVYFVGLAEYIYIHSGKMPPRWVEEQEYFLPVLTYQDGTEYLCATLRNDEAKAKFRAACLEEAIPEFLRHNLVVNDVMSAF